MSDEQVFWEREPQGEAEAVTHRRARVTWAQLLPRDQRTTALWMAASVIVLALSGQVGGWLLGRFDLQGIAFQLLGGALRVIVLAVFVAAAVGWFRAPRALIGFSLLECTAGVPAALIASASSLALSSTYSSLEPAANRYNALVVLLRSSHGLVVMAVSAIASVAVWKVYQARSEETAIGADGDAWRKALAGLRSAVGLGAATSPTLVRLVVGAFLVDATVRIAQQLIDLPALIASSAGAGAGWVVVLTDLAPIVAFAIVMAVAYSRFRLPVGAWLPIATPSIYSIVMLPVTLASSWSVLKGGSLAQALEVFGIALAVSVATIVAILVYARIAASEVAAGDAALASAAIGD